MVALAVGMTAASAAASIGSAAMQSSAAGDAADKQSQSAAAAQQQQAAQYAQTRADLYPYNSFGQNALSMLGNNLTNAGAINGEGLSTGLFYATQAQNQFDQAAQIGQGPGGQAALEATPGYQFALQQGLKATQNSAAARGLGVSGAAMKGAATYATGLADQTYLDQYKAAVQNAQNTQSTAGQFFNANNLYQNNLNGATNRLMSVAGLGENAAAQTGNLGQQSAAAQSALMTGAGNAQAAGIMGGANAWSNGLNGLSNGAQNAYFMNKLIGDSGSTYNGAKAYGDGTAYPVLGNGETAGGWTPAPSGF